MSKVNFAAQIYFSTKGWQTVAVCATLRAAARVAAKAYSTQVNGELPSQARITKPDGTPLSTVA